MSTEIEQFKIWIKKLYDKKVFSPFNFVESIDYNTFDKHFMDLIKYMFKFHETIFSNSTHKFKIFTAFSFRGKNYISLHLDHETKTRLDILYIPHCHIQIICTYRKDSMCMSEGICTIKSGTNVQSGLYDEKFKNIFSEVRNVLNFGFNNLEMIYGYILQPPKLLYHCVKYVKNNRSKFKNLGTLNKDIRKLLKVE